ncbi:MAG: hypothetical protein IT536_13865 [Hyphomicrobiales bacterium]|nr:hypothetical protein [Hyphomicrobiales bacterium]
MALSSLLEICQRAADELSIARQVAYVGGTHADARMLLACANTAGRALMRAHDWGALQTLATVTTTDGTTSYPLAADYDRMIADTGWDRSHGRIMVGPDGAQTHRSLNESGVTGTGARRRFRLQGASIVIWPTPSAAETLVYEYVSNRWARSAAGAAQSEFAADTDTAVFDSELMKAEIKWRYLAAKGLAFDDVRAEALTIRESRIAADLGGTVLCMAPPSDAPFVSLDHLPEGDWPLS